SIEEDPQLVRCQVTKKLVPPDKQLHDWQCLYYIKPIFEDGHPLSPEQHYLIKQAELDNKK
ncbi:MAG: hypothetical protein K6U74_20690, partial [Firmicutes bacterium]|nr:hypothetical protein [Bacillota bacterium]